MIFKGDLSKYHAADALMFVSHLNMNGIMSVAYVEQMLTLSFKNGRLIDGHSTKVDAKLLNILRIRNHIDALQLNRIRQIQSETGLPVRQILSQLKIVSLADIKPILESAMQEVLLELLLIESGAFHFSDTTLVPDEAGIQLDVGAVTLSVAAQADEFRSFLKTVVSLDRGIAVPSSSKLPPDLSSKEQLVFRLISKYSSLGQLIEKAPLASYEVMRIVQHRLEKGQLSLMPMAEQQPASVEQMSVDPVFQAYKHAFKKMINTREILKKVEIIIEFCKQYYDGIYLFTAQDGHFVHCKTISVDTHKNITQKTIKTNLGQIAQEPVFDAVYRSGVGFFGKMFPSELIQKVAGASDQGDCAVLPILTRKTLSIFLFTHSRESFSGLSPHHYLELLSWMIAPDERKLPDQASQCASAQEQVAPPHGAAGDGSANRAEDFIDKIDDLPPLPSFAAKAMNLLSDPDVATEKIEAVISQDQAIVAKLIKVSNSVLYGGVQKVSSLRQALARLGAKTTKGLILTASTKSYFLKNRQELQILGQSLWQHSVECGLASRRIAVVTGFKDPEQAFVGGVMHDIGKLVILMVDPDKYKQIRKLKHTEKISDLEAETRVIGTHHSLIGRLLMDKWHMPADIKSCTEFHHDYTQAGSDQTLAAIVAYGNLSSHVHGAEPHADLVNTNGDYDELYRALELTTEMRSRLAETIASDFQGAAMIL